MRTEQNIDEASELDPEFTIKTKNNVLVQGKLIQVYPKGKLWYAQNRICITDLDNNEIDSIDVIELVCRIRPVEYFELKDEKIDYTFEDRDDLNEESLDHDQ